MAASEQSEMDKVSGIKAKDQNGILVDKFWNSNENGYESER